MVRGYYDAMAGEELKKSLVIHPTGIHDIANLMAVARAQAREAFHTRKVHVYPWVAKHEDDFIVVVEVNEMESHKQPGAGER